MIRSDGRWGESVQFKISGFNAGRSVADQRFKSLSVKETKEVVSIGLPIGVAPHTDAAPHLTPQQWQITLDQLSTSSGNESTLHINLYPVLILKCTWQKRRTRFSWTCATCTRAALATSACRGSRLFDHLCVNSPISRGIALLASLAAVILQAEHQRIASRRRCV